MAQDKVELSPESCYTLGANQNHPLDIRLFSYNVDVPYKDPYLTVSPLITLHFGAYTDN
jgi:hypothetical protein